jgi:biotin carboxyl carrier protein
LEQRMNEELHCGELILAPRVKRLADGVLAVVLDGQEHRIEHVSFRNGELRFEYDGQRHVFHALILPREVQVTDGVAFFRFQRREPGAAEATAASGAELVSQMPGKVLKLLCEPGQRVEPGAPLLILEAMKMEHEICAPSDGVVRAYPQAEGERVMPGSLLVHFEPNEGVETSSP